MKLQILVPRFNEPESVIEPLLNSINWQVDVDFNDIGVVICDDGSSTKLSDEFLSQYKYKIQYITLPSHQGVSVARQACFDIATADYVMWCDADDLFYNLCGLDILKKEIDKKDGFDVLVSCFIEETRDENNTPQFLNIQNDSTFVHGKVFRRQYLIDENIRWNPKLTIHEDSFFNSLAIELLGDPNRGKYCQSSFYLWKWRDDSVCRRDDEYIFKTFTNLIDSNEALIEELLSRDMEKKAQFYCCSLVSEAFYQLNKNEWMGKETQVYRDNVEKRFAKYYKKYKYLFEVMPETNRMEISNSVRNRMVQEGMPMERITLSDWLDKIMEV